MTRQSLFIWGALLVTMWLSWDSYQHQQLQENSAKLVLPTRVLSPQQTQQQAVNQKVSVAGDSSTLQLSIRQAMPSQIDLFAAPKQIVEIPTKTPRQPVQAALPIAPPLPFKFLGRIDTGDSKGVLLNVNNEVMPIKTGDILLGQYVVQTISESEAGVQVQFLYQPLNQVQTLTGLTTN